MLNKRRVVVTGLGIKSPVGSNLEKSWENIINGVSGIEQITSFSIDNFSTKFAGIVNDFDSSAYFDGKELRRIDKFIQYGIAASIDAIEHAGIASTNVDVDRVGVIVGSGIGGIESIEKVRDNFISGGQKKVTPFFIPASIINMISGKVSIKYGFTGPNLAFSTACTTGTHSICQATRIIQYGDADVMVCGGAEKASCEIGLAGFAQLKALSTRNEDPQSASRPFDRDRDGFVLGDGAGVLVLEEYEHAKKRGANILAEVKGVAMNADAYHITRPSGVGAENAIRLAIKDSKLDLSSFDYINAHATSTMAGDVEESEAIKRVFGDHAYKLLVSSTKSMTGHLLGAAGGIEAIFSVLSIVNNIAPPTINLDNPDPKCDLNYVANEAIDREIKVALSNSFGFGGTNSAVIFAKL